MINAIMMEPFDENLLIKDALPLLFERYNIPANAYETPYFYIRVGPLSIPVPNIPARVKIARFHDIHHLLTGYPANWKGEAEIGIWELITGCRTSFIAWFLNSGAVMVGAILYPKAVFQAFKRGLHTRTNLYHDFDYDSLLLLTIKEVKERIGLKA